MMLKKKIDDVKNKWQTMYFDGVMNIFKNGTRVEIISLSGRKYPISIKQEFECTNNIMAYGACILA